MNIFIGMESSGVIRRAFQKLGHFVISVDLLPAVDVGVDYDTNIGGHVMGDVFTVFDNLDFEFHLGIFHPPCTYLTCSAEWAYADGPYHQKIKRGTLAGKERREARVLAIEDVRRIMALPIPKKAIENPVGVLSRAIRKPDQIIQPYQFGDDASKKTCLWLENLLPLQTTKRIDPRYVNGLPRWSNQTDSGQNKLTPGVNRWRERSKTYQGIANAIADQWGKLI